MGYVKKSGRSIDMFSIVQYSLRKEENSFYQYTMATDETMCGAKTNC
jgi:hypothetical protein